MSKLESVTETTVATPAPEQEPNDTFVLTFNKKKIAKIAAISTAAAAAVAGAVCYFKKAEDSSVTVEPLTEEDGFVVYETSTDQD
jgi:UPF0288 family protein (methanogenesis marker protein 3)